MKQLLAIFRAIFSRSPARADAVVLDPKAIDRDKVFRKAFGGTLKAPKPRGSGRFEHTRKSRDQRPPAVRYAEQAEAARLRHPQRRCGGPSLCSICQELGSGNLAEK